MQTPNPQAPDFAGLSVKENATVITIPLADSFILIDVFDHDCEDRNSQSDQANEKIIVGSSGVYRVAMSGHSLVGAANKEYEAFIYEVAPTGSAITGSTQADPVVVTATAHGFSNGDEVLIQGVTTMVELNDRIFKVADKAANTFELTDDGGASPGDDIDGSGFAGAGTGGTAYLATRTRVHFHREFVTANITEPDSDHCLASLTAGQWIMAFVANRTDTTDILYSHITVTIERVG